MNLLMLIRPLSLSLSLRVFVRNIRLLIYCLVCMCVCMCVRECSLEIECSLLITQMMCVEEDGKAQRLSSLLLRNDLVKYLF
jgi:hypothetical protein